MRKSITQYFTSSALKLFFVVLISFTSSREVVAQFSVNGPTSACVNSILTFSVNGVAQSPHYVYEVEWMVDGSMVQLSIDNTNGFPYFHTFTVSGQHTVQAYVAYDGGYELTPPLTVQVGNVASTPSISSDQHNACEDGSITLTVTNAQPELFTYQWSSTPAGFTATGTSATFSNLPGTTTFKVDVIGACTPKSNTKSISPTRTGTLALSPDLSDYHVRTLTRTGSGYIQFNDPDGTSINNVLQVTEAGTYYLRAQCTNGTWATPSPGVVVDAFNYAPPAPQLAQVPEYGYTKIKLINTDKDHLLKYAEFHWVSDMNSTVSLGRFSEGYEIALPGTYYLRGKDKGTGTWGAVTAITIQVIGDEGINFIHTKAFDGIASEPYSESKSYFDPAGKLLQTQSKIHTDNSDVIFTTGTLYDQYDRAVGSTLPAPIQGNEFKYTPGFVLNDKGEPYNYNNFDLKESTLADPVPVGKNIGTVGWYYSAQNTLEENVPITDYPYARQEFYEDGTGEVKRSSSPGEEHRMGRGHEPVSGTFPVYNELDDYLQKRFLAGLSNNDITTLLNKGVQSVVRDENGVYAISLADKEGKSVMSALQGDLTNNVLTVENAVTSMAGTPPDNVNNPTDYRKLTYFYILHDQVINITIQNGATYVIEDLLSGSPYTPGQNSEWEAGFYRIILTSDVGQISFSYTNYYKDVSYQFYNDAGRLVTSISPNGMNQLKNAVGDFSLIDKTTYTYNHRGWLLNMTEPDAGTSTYMYRRDGSIRFSQNAQQATENHFSYTHYDRLGRPVESGEYKGSTLDSETRKGQLEYSQQVLWEGNDTRDWVKTHYDLPAESIENVPPTYQQQFVRSSVSWTENENIKTWYSYDELGRVTWMAQKPKALDRTFVIEYQYDFLGNVLQVRSLAYKDQVPMNEFYHHYTYDADKRLSKVYTSTDGATLNLRATYVYYLHGPLKRVELGNKLQGIDFVYNINGWLKQINHPDNLQDPGADGQGGSEFKEDVFGMLFDYYDSEFDGLFQTSFIPQAPNPNGFKEHDYLDPIHHLIQPALASKTDAVDQPVMATEYSVEKSWFHERLSKYYDSEAISLNKYTSAASADYQENIKQGQPIASRSNTYSAVAVPERRFLIDFGSPANLTTVTGWNNVTSVSAGSIINLVANDGASSSLNLEVITEPSAGYDPTGGDFNASGYNGQVLDYPATACGDSHYAYSGGGTYRINGLNVSKTYTLTIFASRSPVTDNREAVYTIGAQQLTLNAANNTSTTVQFVDIVPSGSGTITIGFNVAAGSSFGYINVLDIVENGVGPTLQNPTNLTAQVSGTNVTLSWTDNATGEEGYRIERRTTSGQYAPIASINADSQQYVDNSVAAGSYDYRVYAFTSTEQSGYSNEVSATISGGGGGGNPSAGGRRFLIDFGTSTNQTTASGWNNITSVTSGSTFMLLESNGNTSSVALEVITEPSSGYDSNGGDSNHQGHNGSVMDYPASACGDSHYAHGAGGTYRLNGLDNGKTYSIRIFGSRTSVTDQRVGVYTIGAQQLTLETANNTSATIQFADIVPSANGTITMDFNVAAGSTFGYINVLDITESGSGLDAPTNLMAQVSGSDVQLSWTDNTSTEDGFKIERAPTSTLQFTEIGAVNSGVTQFMDVGVANGSYAYRVYAYATTEQSAYSNEATVQITEIGDPPTPLRRYLIDFGDPAYQTTLTGWNNVTSVTSGSQISLVEEDGSATSVVLEVITEPSGGYDPAGGDFNSQGYNDQVLDYPATACRDSHYAHGAGGTYRLSGLDVSKTYSIRIFGSRSPVTDTRVGVYAINSEQLTLEAANNTSATIQFVDIAPSATGTIIIDFNVNAGSSFAYINVLDIIENGVASSIPAPDNLTAQVTGADVTLSWNDNASNEAGYRVERKLIGESQFVEIASLAPDVTAFVDAGLPGGTYIYRVLAFTSTEQSGYSGEVQVAVNATATLVRRFLVDFGGPANPTTATGWNNITSVISGSVINLMESEGNTSSVNLEVVTEPAVGYDPTGGDFNEQGYNGPVLDYPASACMDSHYAHSTGGTYQLTGLDITKTYTIQIFASRSPVSDNRTGLYTINGQQLSLNAANNTSATVQVADVVPTTGGVITLDFNVASGSLFGYLNVLDVMEYASSTTLNAPTLTSVTQAPSGVQISWSDNSTMETGFGIYRSVSATGTYTTIGSVAANSTSYVDASAVAGQTYYYKVRALDSGAGSPYSNVISFTPVAAPLVVTAIGNQVVSFNSPRDVMFNVSTSEGIPLDRSHIVILGSSTAEGYGASSPQQAWASLYTTFVGQYDHPFTLINLASGGFSTEDILPSGDPNRNITKALTYNPLMIIINLPSNDVSDGISPATMMNNLAAVKQQAENAGVKVFITTTQPRDFTSSAQRALLQTLANNIIDTYGNEAINIYEELTDAGTLNIKSQYNSGDGIHVNNAGHNYIFQQVKAQTEGFLNKVRFDYLLTQTPSFVTLVDTDNGTGKIVLQPTVGDIGIYEGITLTVRDMNGQESVQSFSVEVRNADALPVSNLKAKPLYNGIISAISWHTDKVFLSGKEDYKGMYLYSYDDKYQIKEANWAEPTYSPTGNTYAVSGNKFRLTGMDYDPNGNILALKRYDEYAVREHNFSYHYDPILSPEELITNPQMDGLTGYAASGPAIVSAETINGENYVRVESGEVGVHGIATQNWIPVNAGDKMTFKVKGYRETSGNAYFWIQGFENNVNIVWLNTSTAGLPLGQENEGWRSVNFVVPQGVTKINAGVRFANITTTGDVFHLNEMSLRKISVYGNRLSKVTGYTHAYTYNAVGQMIGSDKETGDDQYVEYDVTGKVKAVYSDAIHSKLVMSNLYDDRGFRLAKVSYPKDEEESPAKTTWYIRDAAGNVVSIYEQEGEPDAANTASLVQTEIPIYGSGKIGTYYADKEGSVTYEITDHLGNVRALLREDESKETATLEGNNMAHERGAFLNYDNIRRVNASIFNHTPASGSQYSMRLSGSENEKTGLAKSLIVQPGDTVKMEVFGKYVDPSGGNVTAALNNLITAIATGTASAGTVVDGAGYGSTGNIPIPGDGWLDKSGEEEGPKAYLNYMLFDTDFQFVDGGFVKMSTAAAEDGSDVPHEHLWADYIVPSSGYMYIYLSNEEETPLEVYFDDFRVQHKTTYVSQATDYGVWGDVIREEKVDDRVYRFGYQGQFAERDLETGWNHFELREYDPVVGRWTGVDPKRQYPSPYIAFGNNPINRVDPDGGSDNGPDNPFGEPLLDLELTPGPTSYYNMTTGKRFTWGINDYYPLDFDFDLNLGLPSYGDLARCNDWANNLSDFGDVSIGTIQGFMLSGGKSLPLYSKNFRSIYSSLDAGLKLTGRVGVFTTFTSLYFDYNAATAGGTDNISWFRFSWRTMGNFGSLGVGMYVGGAAGGPAGSAAGGAVGGMFYVFEQAYDGIRSGFERTLTEIHNFNEAIKNGWQPGSSRSWR